MKKFAARALLTGLIAVAGFASVAFGTAEKASAATQVSLSLVSIGKNYIGTPYLYGSAPGTTSTFDCSSYTQHIFGAMGVWLPRTSSAQAYMGEKVDRAYLSVGDLIFFRTGGAGISHVGIYAGNGNMLHASSSKGVTLSNINTSYWNKAYVTARRVL
ncbi:C40 family peptidase [Cohnella panacarvi]|uniref:C40 family peptidase n=1 Tax=Cohnella panacarvi TaxID=400776 RepID=UPI00047B8A37|nr:C40 family peptidase [Cohnella panacarvi]